MCRYADFWRGSFALAAVLAALCVVAPVSGQDPAEFNRKLELARERYAKCLVQAEDEGFFCHQACLKDRKRRPDAREGVSSSYDVRVCYGICENRMDQAMGRCQKTRADEEDRIERDRRKARQERGTK